MTDKGVNVHDICRFLKMTEKGSTPVLKINEEDKVITDSAEILEYLDDKIAEPHLGSPSDIPERCALM